MKQMNLNHQGIVWHVYMSVDGLGLMDTTVYRPRVNKKWWQSSEQLFLSIMTCPKDMSEQIELVKHAIDDKLLEEQKLNNLLAQYRELEDVPFI